MMSTWGMNWSGQAGQCTAGEGSRGMGSCTGQVGSRACLRDHLTITCTQSSTPRPSPERAIHNFLVTLIIFPQREQDVHNASRFIATEHCLKRQTNWTNYEWKVNVAPSRGAGGSEERSVIVRIGPGSLRSFFLILVILFSLFFRKKKNFQHQNSF